ncbi:hypothetical protein BKA70DRAFT_1483363 [Coprinopsis sp. MPI-PUGE-AT-0042]|nr:hypothetical protein BKA70DRAFT_1483363 [Coprinopsis sp. MPI-PUGE-AT-0042]
MKRQDQRLPSGRRLLQFFETWGKVEKATLEFDIKNSQDDEEDIDEEDVKDEGGDDAFDPEDAARPTSRGSRHTSYSLTGLPSAMQFLWLYLQNLEALGGDVTEHRPELRNIKKKWEEDKATGEWERPEGHGGQSEAGARLGEVEQSRRWSAQCQLQAGHDRKALHLNRSIHYGSHPGKHNVRVPLLEMLGLTPYITSDSLSTRHTHTFFTPSSAPSASFPPSSSSSTGASSSFNPTNDLHAQLHRLSFRRKPRKEKKSKDEKWRPPMLIDRLRLAPSSEEDSPSTSISMQGGEREDANRVLVRNAPDDMEDEEEHPFDDAPSQPSKGWLRISDHSVREVGIKSFLAEGTGVFMLYHERAVHPRPGIYSGHMSASPSESWTITGRDKGMESEETLKPDAKVKRVELNGSAAALVSDFGLLSSNGKSGISLLMDDLKSQGEMGGGFCAEDYQECGSGEREEEWSVQPVLASAVTSQSRDLHAPESDSGNSGVNGSAAPSASTAATSSSLNLAPKIAKSPLTATTNGAPVLPSQSPLLTLAETPSATTPSGPLSASKPPPKSPSKKGKKSAKAGPPLVSPVVNVGDPEP